MYSIDGNFVTDSLFTGLASGLYTVTVLDQNGCADTLDYVGQQAFIQYESTVDYGLS